MVVDASVILKGFFPDEEGKAQAQALIRDYTLGAIQLVAPTLLPYEVANAVLQAVRRERIVSQKAEEILDTFIELSIPTFDPSIIQALQVARQFTRSAYDAAYLVLAMEQETSLITGDRRLYNAVCDHLDWITWIGDYTS